MIEPVPIHTFDKPCPRCKAPLKLVLKMYAWWYECSKCIWRSKGGTRG